MQGAKKEVIAAHLRARVMVVADDLGRTRSTNRAIVDAMRHGAVDAASLMVGAPHAATAATAFATCSLPQELGLHLTLTEGAPLCAPTDTASLRDPLTGGFWDKHAFWARCVNGAISDTDVFRETRAQLRRFAELTGGRSPAHVDGHHHCHVASPGVALAVGRAVAESADRVGVLPRIRIPAEAHPRVRGCVICERARTATERVAPVLLSTFCFPTTDHFVGQSLCSTARVDADMLRGIVETTLEGSETTTVELMCHPAYHVPSSGSWYEGPQREEELRLLLDLLGNGSAA